MKITVDTQADSREEIRRVISILSAFLEKSRSSQHSYSSSSPSIFSDNPPNSSVDSGCSNPPFSSSPSSVPKAFDTPSIFSLFDDASGNKNVSGANNTALIAKQYDKCDDEEIDAEDLPKIEFY